MKKPFSNLPGMWQASDYPNLLGNSLRVCEIHPYSSTQPDGVLLAAALGRAPARDGAELARDGAELARAPRRPEAPPCPRPCPWLGKHQLLLPRRAIEPALLTQAITLIA